MAVDQVAAGIDRDVENRASDASITDLPIASIVGSLTTQGFDSEVRADLNQILTHQTAILHALSLIKEETKRETLVAAATCQIITISTLYNHAWTWLGQVWTIRFMGTVPLVSACLVKKETGPAGEALSTLKTNRIGTGAAP